MTSRCCAPLWAARFALTSVGEPDDGEDKGICARGKLFVKAGTPAIS